MTTAEIGAILKAAGIEASMTIRPWPSQPAKPWDKGVEMAR
jgi:hypothetical protein